MIHNYLNNSICQILRKKKEREKQNKKANEIGTKIRYLICDVEKNILQVIIINHLPKKKKVYHK